MSKHGIRKSNNFGFGNNIEYATKNALQLHYGGGHYQTVNTHIARCRLFYDWLRSTYGIRDARKITNEILAEYTLYLITLLSEEKISIATATNRVSSVNKCLEIMREDRHVRIDKISAVLGEKRCYIRRSIPDGMGLSEVHSLHIQLIQNGFSRSAAIVLLARSTGMRLRECILANLPRLIREAVNHRINIQDGCKGGRSGAFAPRWISVTDEILYALDYARQVSPVGSRNLLAPDETYLRFLRREVNPSRPLMKLHGIKGPHELRAAYACDRYKSLVETAAPIFPSPERADIQDRDDVRAARQIISRELGHERLEVTNSYVGSETR